MPLYDYHCSKCGSTFEAIKKMSDNEWAECECGYSGKKLVSAPAGIAGNSYSGYSHRTGSTGVWKEDMGPNGPKGREWYGDMPHAPSTLDKIT